MTQNAPHSFVPLYWGESQQKSQEQLPGVGIRHKKKDKAELQKRSAFAAGPPVRTDGETR